jgi:hypothetical protein
VHLDVGKLAASVLREELHADLLLIDDRIGREGTPERSSDAQRIPLTTKSLMRRNSNRRKGREKVIDAGHSLKEKGASKHQKHRIS